MISLKEIAKMTNLSISTVSKVINNKSEDLSNETIEKVLKIAKKYNYVPYGKIRNKNNTKSLNIALILKDLRKSYLVLTEISKVFRERGYSLFLYDSQGSLENEHENMSKLLSKEIDGIIWETIDGEKSPFYKKLTEQDKIKVIFINSKINYPLNYSINFLEMAYKATQELINKGHTNILCYYKKDSYRGLKTLEGYRMCLFDNKIINRFENRFSLEDIEASKIKIDNCSAVICSHYSAASHLYTKLSDNQYVIPQEISIVTLKNDPKNIFETKKISFMEIPNKEFGEFISSKLIDYLEFGELELDDFEFNYKLDSKVSIEPPNDFQLPSVLVVGSINVDNMIFLEEFPQLGKVHFSKKNVKFAGGKALNQSIGLKLLGQRVKCLGKIGNDEFADLITKTLISNNIDPQFIIRDKSYNTGTAYIPINHLGESSILLDAGANNNLTVEDIEANKKLFKNNAYTLIQTEIPINTAYHTIKMAKKYGSKTIVKPAAIDILEDDIYKYIDIFIPNKVEAEVLSSLKSPEEQANYFLEKGVKAVVITLDHSGAYLKTNNISKFFEAEETTVIDETGASDAFIAAFCSKMIETSDFYSSIIAGNIAASYCISNYGVSESLIDKQSLDREIKKRDYRQK